MQPRYIIVVRQFHMRLRAEVRALKRNNVDRGSMSLVGQNLKILPPSTTAGGHLDALRELHFASFRVLHLDGRERSQPNNQLPPTKQLQRCQTKSFAFHQLVYQNCPSRPSCSRDQTLHEECITLGNLRKQSCTAERGAFLRLLKVRN